MKSSMSLRAILIGCLSCTLGACVMARPGEEDSDDSFAISTEEEDGHATAVDPDEFSVDEADALVSGDEADIVGCHPEGNYCLARCSKSGSTWNVVGHWNQLDDYCTDEGETYCKQMQLGYRTQVCWGYVKND